MSILCYDRRPNVPQRIICLVCLSSGETQGESESEWQTLRAGYAIHARWRKKSWRNQNQAHLSSVQQLLTWLTQSLDASHATYLYSPRMAGALTLAGLLSSLASGDFTLCGQTSNPIQRSSTLLSRSQGTEKRKSILMESAGATIATLRSRSGCDLVCCDIANYLHQPGHVLSGLVSLSWPEIPRVDAPQSEWDRCAKLRCDVIYRCITQLINFWRYQELGSWTYTVAGNALSAFRNRAMVHEIVTPALESTRDFERLAIHGAITEARWVGKIDGNRYVPHPHAVYRPQLFDRVPKGNLYLLDATSYYGSLHLEHDLPSELINYGESLTIDEAKQIIVDDSFMATVVINTPLERFPTRDNSRFAYCTGHFDTTLCGPELLRAIQTNSVVRVGHWHRYRMLPIFRRYAEIMWKLRQHAREHGNLLIDSWCKQLIARLHGKFAQRNHGWKCVDNVPAMQEWGEWRHYSSSIDQVIRYRAIGGNVQQLIDDGDASHCFPAITAWVQSQGREMLRLYSQIAGDRQVLYVATDSLITTQLGYDRLKAAGLIGDNEIGQLKIKAQGNSIEIRGAGCMEFAGRLWLSGISRPPDKTTFGSITTRKVYGLSTAIADNGNPRVHVVTREVSPEWHYDPSRTDDYGWINPPQLSVGDRSCRLKESAEASWVE